MKGFKTQLAFISNFTANFEVGPDKAQFAAVTFSTGVHKDFYLNEHTDQASVLGAIDKIQFRDGETYTDQGLNFVRNNVLQGIPINWLVFKFVSTVFQLFNGKVCVTIKSMVIRFFFDSYLFSIHISHW